MNLKDRSAIKESIGTRISGGVVIGWSPVIHQTEPPRNKPCPCGSGIKYKKCCFKSEHRLRPILNTENL